MAPPRAHDVATALSSLMAGAGTGGLVLSAALLLVRRSQDTLPGLNRAAGGDAPPQGASELATGAIAALLVAAALAFHRARSFGSRWQRVAVGALAALGTVLLAILAVPLDVAFGRIGLLALALLCLGLLVAGLVWSRHTVSEDGP